MNKNPGIYLQIRGCVAPRSKAGLIGKAAIDMRERDWDGFKALRQGGNGFWWFLGPCGHTALIFGQLVRNRVKEGKRVNCPACSRQAKAGGAR